MKILIDKIQEVIDYGKLDSVYVENLEFVIDELKKCVVIDVSPDVLAVKYNINCESCVFDKNDSP